MLMLYFRCLEVCVECLDLYLGVWTCIWTSGLVFFGTHHPVVYVFAAGTFVWGKGHPWIVHGCEALLVQMTMSARRASEIPVRRRAVLPDMSELPNLVYTNMCTQGLD